MFQFFKKLCLLKPYQNSSFAIVNLKFYIILVLTLCAFLNATAQKKPTYDTLPKLDSISSTFYYKPWITIDAPTQKTGLIFSKKQNDKNFFIAIGVLLIFALIRSMFTKYVKDLWQITLQNTFRLSAIKAQISANATASLLMNIYFAIVLGCFLNVLLQYNQIVIINNSIVQLILCCTLVGIVYTLKYLFVLICGVLFQQKKASSDYIFIIFLCNKIIAMLLMPIVLYLLVSNTYQKTFIVIALFIICVLFLFRHLFSLLTIVKQLQMQKLHFFMYLCATEILPLMIAYKFLVIKGLNGS
jgi:hypothetical protein